METTKNLNTPFPLAATVACNPEKVTAERLMATPYGGVNVIAMKSGQRLERHTAPAAVTVAVLEGKLEFVVEGIAHTMGAGDALLMAAGTPHHLTALADTKFMLIKIDE